MKVLNVQWFMAAQKVGILMVEGELGDDQLEPQERALVVGSALGFDSDQDIDLIRSWGIICRVERFRELIEHFKEDPAACELMRKVLE